MHTRTRTPAPPHPPVPFPLCNGGALDMLAPDPGSVDLAALGEGVAKLARFCGHTPGSFYSVAQHSVIVGGALPADDCGTGIPGALRAYGLLHDLHEAVIGDLTVPIKVALVARCPEFLPALERIKADIDRAIFTACGLPHPMPASAQQLVEIIDERCARAEAEQLGVTLPPSEVHPLAATVKPLGWEAALEQYLDMLLGFRALHGWAGPAWDRLEESRRRY